MLNLDILHIILSILSIIFFILFLKSKNNNSKVIVDNNEEYTANLKSLETKLLEVTHDRQDLQNKLDSFNNITEEEFIFKASRKAKEIIDESNRKVQLQEIQSQEYIQRQKDQLKSDKHILIEDRAHLDEREKTLLDRAKQIDVRFLELQDKEVKLIERNHKLDSEYNERISNIENEEKKIKDSLFKIANLTPEEAEKLVMSKINDELIYWKAKKIRETLKQIENDADEKAQHLLIESMIRGATDSLGDVAVTRFKLDNDELKGKIIGKEGRNIKALEKATGCEVLIDQDDSAITISCFDPIRREVAGITLARLLKDGRLHPGSIEEMVERVKQDLLRVIKKEGTDLAFKCGFTDLPDEILKLLGKFKYRFSYGQNLAKHTIEMVQMGEYIARELKLDVKVVKLACLLHDIGKVVITDSLGNDTRQHHHISGEIARKYDMDWKVVNAIEAHHDDIASECLEAEIVKIADKISGSRDGARRENYEEYIKRIQELESIAKEFKGVSQVFAIYAGRELRVMVEPVKLSDAQCEILALDIAKTIEGRGLNYPGNVKVTVIREIRKYAEAH